MKKELCCIDALEWLQSAETNTGCRMMFADPPDGIGMKYNGFKDKISPADYESMLYNILWYGSQASKVIWLSINSRYAAMIGHATWEFLKLQRDWEFKPCVQTFTFGQHNHRDLGNNHRLLYRYKREGVQLYPDAVRVPSWRQLNGDKRADDRGRVPGDVFDFRVSLGTAINDVVSALHSFTKTSTDAASSCAALAETLSSISSQVVEPLDESPTTAE
jgi:hypothetical protein